MAVNPSGSDTGEEQEAGLTSQDFVEQLKRALRSDGDFPASAKVVSELRRLVSNPNTTANQISELILREPSLGTRVLHLVNSSFYQRSKPIMTVSQAVVQIGMQPLSELCSGLVLLQKFIPAARQGGIFSAVLQKTITTSLLTSSISSHMKDQGNSKTDESGYLAGSFYEMGTLLMAYYFPKMYEAALKRTETKRQPLFQSIRDLTGHSPVQLSIKVIEELQLPQFYREVLLAAEHGAPLPQTDSEESATPDGYALGEAVYAAHALSEVIVYDGTKEALDRVLGRINESLVLETTPLNDVIGTLPTIFREHCLSLELPLPDLPSFIQSYRGTDALPSGGEEAGELPSEDCDTFSQFVDEIRLAIDNREPTASVITTVMETFAWSLGFDRVFLLLVNHAQQRLVGRMLLGNCPDFDPKECTRPLGNQADPHAPEAKAIAESRPIFRGDPIFEDGWPLAAIPIGFEKRVIGAIYADRIGDDNPELSAREQAAIGVLAELLDRSVSVNR